MEPRKTKPFIYGSEEPWGLLLKMSVPSVVSSLIMLVYNMADVFFIGQLQDRLQVAAVSLCSPLFTLLSAVGVLFGNGGCLRAATLLGQGKRDEVRSVTAFCCSGFRREKSRRMAPRRAFTNRSSCSWFSMAKSSCL